ncbi:intracellular protein transporter USO, putative (macronuclear) [Tetrahymena thermophila SB210]|uniref:Intracellular protein transporter USO, putative n=1 Tax=Tetrahymena thermophila (strain SB210) TaxID=312017 RepID=Q235C0_TETTS|nr:intracellular protein transporter USO, putative [Tetrahymena thermophila SB210]EAR92183.2 intracellular protein transporter USO, putative [Tetrahymena thermophila SB210]|eukprot:XP_001012428.2 intracellular protein transporter USO, putative [Tetrahymena thermophila SB210]
MLLIIYQRYQKRQLKQRRKKTKHISQFYQQMKIDMSILMLKILLYSSLFYTVRSQLHNEASYKHQYLNESNSNSLKNVYQGDSDQIQKRSIQQAPQKLRIAYDYSLIDNNSTLTQQEKTLVKNVCEAAKLFISSLVKVNSRQSPITIEPTTDLCYDIPYSDMVVSPNSVNDADLFIMVVSFYNDTTTMVANAISCQFDQMPTMGRISINSAYINDKYIQKYGYMFQNVLSHELIHVLGFSFSSINQWIDPKTNQAFGDWFIQALDQDQINGVDYYLLQTDNVNRLFQRHFSCQQISGMPLEKDLSNHWTRLAIFDEVMNPYIFNLESDFSQFTTAMLRDIGYYLEVNDNLVKFSGWGLNQGCSFIQNTCLDPSIQFEEFNYASNNRTFDCDVNGHGKAMLPSKETDLETCQSFEIQDTQYCTLTNVDPIQYTGEQYSPLSKCIRSSYQKSTISNPFLSAYGNTRCYKTICLNDGTLQISTITGQQYICKYPGQMIQISNEENQGYIQCPTRFQPYCFFKKFCPNSCSQKGFCIDGVCICIDGQGGEDCSVQIEGNQALYQGNLVDSCPNGFIKNPNRVCLSGCPLGYYQSEGQCLECYGKCSQCTGPGQNQCTKCSLDYILIGNTCYESDQCYQTMLGCRICYQDTCYQCQIGYYMDQSNQCQPCSSDCLACVNSPDFCTQCLSNQFLSENQCIDQSDAMQGCLALDQNSQKVCTLCSDLYTLDENGQCQLCPTNQFFSFNQKMCKQCSSNCLTCKYQEDYCTSCDKGFIFNEIINKCIPYPSESKLAKSDIFQCHRTCSKCYDESYTSCGQCVGNRQLLQTSKQYVNICLSPDQSTDYLDEICQYDYLSSQVIFAILTLHIIAISKQLFRVVFLKKRLFKLAVLIYTYQTLSYFRFINYYFPLEVDTILRSLQIYNLFNYQISKVDFEVEQNVNINPKFLVEQKSPYFFTNTIVIMVIIGTINLVQEIHYFVRNLKKKFYYQSLLLITTFINFFAIQELLINLFACISFFDYNSSAKAQLILGFLIFIILKAVTIRNILILVKYQEQSMFDQQQTVSEIDEDKQQYQDPSKDKKGETQIIFSKQNPIKIEDSQLQASPHRETDDSRNLKHEENQSIKNLIKKTEKVDLRRMVINKQLQNKIQNKGEDKTHDSSPHSKNGKENIYQKVMEDLNFSASFNGTEHDQKNENKINETSQKKEEQTKQVDQDYKKQEHQQQNQALLQEYQKTETESPIQKYHETNNSPEQLLNQQTNALMKNKLLDSFSLNSSNASELNQKQQDLQFIDALTDVESRQRNSSLFKRNQDAQSDFESPMIQPIKPNNSAQQQLADKEINVQYNDKIIDSFVLNSTNRSELNTKQLDIQIIDAKNETDIRQHNQSQFKKSATDKGEVTLNYPFSKILLKCFFLFLLERIIFTVVIAFFYENYQDQIFILISLQIIKFVVFFISRCYLKKISQFKQKQILESITLTTLQLGLMLGLTYLKDKRILSIIFTSVLILSFFIQVLLRQIREIIIFFKQSIIKIIQYLKSKKQISAQSDHTQDQHNNVDQGSLKSNSIQQKGQ